MRDRTNFTLILLTFLGMVGIYIGAWLAYQKYQQYQAQINQTGNTLGVLGSLFGGK